MRRWKPRHHDIASSCSGWVEVRALAGPVHLGLPSLVDSGKGIRRCHHCEDCLKSRGSIIFSDGRYSDRSDGRVGRFWSFLQKIGCPKWKREGRSYIAIAGVDAYIISPRLSAGIAKALLNSTQWVSGRSLIGALGVLAYSWFTKCFGHSPRWLFCPDIKGELAGWRKQELPRLSGPSCSGSRPYMQSMYV